MLRHGLVAQRITRLTTDQKIAGSNPAEIETIFRNFIYFLAIESKRLAPPGCSLSMRFSAARVRVEYSNQPSIRARLTKLSSIYFRFQQRKAL